MNEREREVNELKDVSSLPRSSYELVLFFLVEQVTDQPEARERPARVIAVKTAAKVKKAASLALSPSDGRLSWLTLTDFPRILWPRFMKVRGTFWRARNRGREAREEEEMARERANWFVTGGKNLKHANEHDGDGGVGKKVVAARFPRSSCSTSFKLAPKCSRIGRRGEERNSRTAIKRIFPDCLLCSAATLLIGHGR